MTPSGRLARLTILTLVACGGDATAPSGPPPAVSGTYEISGHSTNDPVFPFTFTGTLELSQSGDPPGETVEGTLTVKYSRPEWSSAPGPIVDGSVNGDSVIAFIGGTAAGTAVWTGRFTGSAIVNGRFGCGGSGCYEGVWSGNRLPAQVSNFAGKERR